MDKYFFTLYEFICREENFEFAHEISEYFGQIEEKLKNDFWQEVFKKCKSNLDDSFRLRLDRESELIELKKDSWEFTLICRDWEYNEVWIEVKLTTRNKRKRKELEGLFLDEELIDKLGFEYLEEEDIVSGMKITENFDKLSTLKRILPTNREELVNQYSNTIIGKVKILEEEFAK